MQGIYFYSGSACVLSSAASPYPLHIHPSGRVLFSPLAVCLSPSCPSLRYLSVLLSIYLVFFARRWFMGSVYEIAVLWCETDEFFVDEPTSSNPPCFPHQCPAILRITRPNIRVVDLHLHPSTRAALFLRPPPLAFSHFWRRFHSEREQVRPVMTSKFGPSFAETYVSKFLFAYCGDDR